MKKQIVFTYISQQLDYGGDEGRWSRFRPTIALCTSGDIKIDELHLRYMQGHKELAELLSRDINEKCPDIDVHLSCSHYKDADFCGNNYDDIFRSSYQFYSSLSFDYENCDYLVYLPPGRGPLNQLSRILCLSYLNIKCKLITHTVVIDNSVEQQSQFFSAFDFNFSDCLWALRRIQLEGVSSLDFLKFNICTKNVSYNDIINKIETVALNSTAPILLTGEPGVGKTKLARQIYELKKKVSMVSGNFVSVNCSSLKGDGLLSMLFGHTKGAFTGALSARDGLLKTANNGVIFLDEVTEIPISEQPVLLKALEEKRFLPFGADQESSSNFQIICGTNKDIAEEIAKGNFRYDLYARIGMWHCHLPPLRERKEDIPANIMYELQEYNTKTARNVQFLPDARDKYLNFAMAKDAVWKGNMRSLSASIERMATFAIADNITLATVEEEMRTLVSHWSKGHKASDISFALIHQLLGDKSDEIDLFDKFQLENTLKICKAAKTKSDAGKILFAKSRTNKQKNDDTSRLKSYLDSFSITWDDIKALV